jgi:hypothetical protein
MIALDGSNGGAREETHYKGTNESGGLVETVTRRSERSGPCAPSSIGKIT